MIDIVAFVFKVAESVLSDVLADLIKNKKKSASKVEIQEQVIKELLKQYDKQDDEFIIILRQIMREIDLISTRLPPLKVTEANLELSHRGGIISIFERKQSDQDNLTQQLKELHDAVQHRRQEVGMPTRPMKPVKPSNTPQDNNVENKKPGQEDLPTGWIKVKPENSPLALLPPNIPEEFRDLLYRVHLRRSGEQLND